MRKKDVIREVSFREYVREILQHSVYKPCEDSGCVIAVAGVLPGCMTEGDTFEVARELLIDAIELWVLSAIKDGDDLPVVNGCRLAIFGQPEAANA